MTTSYQSEQHQGMLAGQKVDTEEEGGWRGDVQNDICYMKNAHVFLIKNISKLNSLILKFSNSQMKTKIKTKTMGGLATSSRCLPQVVHKKYNKSYTLKSYVIFIALKLKVIIYN